MTCVTLSISKVKHVPCLVDCVVGEPAVHLQFQPLQRSFLVNHNFGLCMEKEVCNDSVRKAINAGRKWRRYEAP